MAIGHGVERVCYARALVRLEELRAPALANGWAGSGLQGRVMRVLGQPSRTPVWPVVAMLAVTLLAAFAPHGVAQVPAPYSLWLNEDVTYIIEPAERKRFELLQTDAEREQFIEQFWKRRDPTPATAENEAKEEHYRRIAYSNQRFKEAGRAGWATEKGKTYIIYGPPDEIESHPRDGYEQWLYHFLEGRGKNVIFTFGKR